MTNTSEAAACRGPCTVSSTLDVWHLRQYMNGCTDEGGAPKELRVSDVDKGAA